MATFTPTRNPRGGGHYDSEENLPYKKGAGSAGDNPPGGGGFRPGGAGRTSNRDAGPGSRHRRQHKSEDLAAAEAGAVSGGSGSGPADTEKKALDEATDSDEGLYNNEGGRGIRGWSRRKKVAGGIGATFGMGAIGVLLLGIGPFQFLQLAQNLQNFHFGNNESFMDGRYSRLYYFGRGSPQNSNLGRFGNTVANIYERKLRAAGFNPDYRDPVTGRATRAMQTFQIDPNTPEGAQALITLRASNVDVPPVGADGLITINTRGPDGTTIRNEVISAAMDSLGLSKVSSWEGNRLMKRRAGAGFKWLNEMIRERFETAQDVRRRNIDRNLEIQEQIDTGRVSDVDPSRRPDDDGRPPVADDGDGIAVPGDPDATAGNIKDIVQRAGAGAVGLVILICTVDQFGDTVGEIQQSNVVLPLIRTGSLAVSMGSQIMANEGFNMDELGALSMRLYDPDTGLGWSAAKSIQAEWGVANPSGPDMPDSGRPGREKPLFFKQLDDFIAAVPGLQEICDLVNNPVVGPILDIADIISAFLAGPGSLFFELLSQSAFFFGAPFIEDLARWLAGEQLDEFAQGALFGNYANYGARLMANDAAVSTGGVELSGTQTAQLDAQRLAANKVKLQSKSAFSRLLDPYEPESLVARTLLRNPNLASPQAAGTHFAQLPTTIFNQIGGSFANLFSPKLQAVNSSGYDYGFPEYGWAMDLQKDTRFNDPYENAAIVEGWGLDHGANLNEKYGERCFNTTISESGVLTTLDSKRMEDIPPDCQDTNEEILRYRFYIADTIAMKSLTCIEDMEESSCSELGFSSGSTAGGGGNGTLPSGDAVSLAQAILDNPNIGKDSEPLGILQSIAGGNSACPSVNADYNVDPELLRVIAALGQNNTFTITSLHRGCTGSTVGAGTASRHWRGKAADISGSRGINGVVLPSFEAYDNTVQTFINEAAGYLPAGCELGVPNERYASGARGTSPACTNIFLDTPSNTGATGPHVHIGVP